MDKKDYCPGVIQKLFGRFSYDTRNLLVPCSHPKLVTFYRAALIITRVRLIAIIFAVLTPMWIALDVAYFPVHIWSKLAVGRIVVSAGFIVLSMLYRRSDNIWHAYIALATMFFIPSLFFLYSYSIFAAVEGEMTGVAVSMVTGYAFLPFVMAAGLSVFPLTVLEGAVFTLPALCVEIISAMSGDNVLIHGSQLGLVWLFVLIASVSILAGMSQLHYLIEITLKSAHDPLTGAFNRASGEELLEKYYEMARRNQSPLLLLFIDLDNFKSVNDQYGHEQGDEVLFRAARSIIRSTRKEDLLIRWGGEEFLLVMPYAFEVGYEGLQKRLFAHGMGVRPDGTPLTASMGIAELTKDRVGALAELVAIADARMYRAKNSGKNSICYGDEDESIQSGLISRPQQIHSLKQQA